jgi:hypothetical protein
MTVRKLVYLDDETAAAARAAAEAEGLSLSAWLSQAAKTATLEHGEQVDPKLIAEAKARTRQLTPEAWQRADATLERLGLDLYSVGV